MRGPPRAPSRQIYPTGARRLTQGLSAGSLWTASAIALSGWRWPAPLVQLMSDQRSMLRRRPGRSWGCWMRRWVPTQRVWLDPAVFTVEQTLTVSSLRAAECPGSGQERRGMGEATMGR
jgi:hypothetical protein